MCQCLRMRSYLSLQAAVHCRRREKKERLNTGSRDGGRKCGGGGRGQRQREIRLGGRRLSHRDARDRCAAQRQARRWAQNRRKLRDYKAPSNNAATQQRTGFSRTLFPCSPHTCSTGVTVLGAARQRRAGASDAPGVTRPGTRLGAVGAALEAGARAGDGRAQHRDHCGKARACVGGMVGP